MVQNRKQEKIMYKKVIHALYAINIVAQCIFTLISSPALLFFINYLLVKHLSFPTWTYAISITLGFIIGIVSMIRFALSASEGLERLEKQSQSKNNTEEKDP
jgi:pilus assembly protein TadC